MAKTRIGFVVLLFSLFAFCFQAEAQNVSYQLTFEGQWTNDLPLPGGAHFSPIVGATHNEPEALFSAGQLASPGVENVAELGSNSVINNEIAAMISSGDAGVRISRSGNVGPVQTVSANFVATQDHSLVSILTMIAPSPDWFVGVHDLNLRDTNGAWHSTITVDLESYDAGTEEGTNFSLNNPATNPREPIAGLDAAEPNGVLFGAGSIARMTLTRLTELTQESDSIAAEIVRGTPRSGGLADLAESDDVDFTGQRSSTDVQSVVYFELDAVSPSETPTEIEFVIEASVFARRTVNQTVDFWNYDNASWEPVNLSEASRFTDSVTTIVPLGDASRFVEAGTRNVRARVRYQSVIARQRFSAGIDEIQWSVTY